MRVIDSSNEGCQCCWEKDGGTCHRFSLSRLKLAFPRGFLIPPSAGCCSREVKVSESSAEQREAFFYSGNVIFLQHGLEPH